jgi:hypothetical protein
MCNMVCDGEIVNPAAAFIIGAAFFKPRSDRALGQLALTKGALADFAITHGEPNPEEQVFPNAWDPAVISYLVPIVVLPINLLFRIEIRPGRH